MRVFVDACVLYPTVLRRLVLAAAETGAFTPLWSPRVLEEWARAAARDGAVAAAAARGEIAGLRAAFPGAEVAHAPADEAGLRLPDPADVHVLAAAIAGGADEILTLNVKDFPTRALAAHGLLRRHPDEFLLEVLGRVPAFEERVDAIAAEAIGDGAAVSRRRLLKKCRLPRLGKALARGGD